MVDQTEAKGFSEGGLETGDDRFKIMQEGFRKSRKKTPEKPKHPLETVPFFQRPMGSSINDIQIGQDEGGNPLFQGRLGTYIIKINPDQRSTREKIEEAIPTVKKAVGDYLKDPTLPTKEQFSKFARDATVGAVESLEETMFTPKGTLGDVFSLASGMGVASLPFDAPKGALRIFGGINMKGAGKDKNLKKAIKLLKESNVDPTKVQESYYKNKEIWKKTGWFVNPTDGQWRFELDDSKANFSKGYKDLFFPSGKGTVTFQELGEVPNSKVLDVKLSDFFNHKDLYNRYPDLKNLKVRFYSNPDSRILGTAYADGSISVNISDFKNYEDIKGTILHEVQHVIQDNEGFVPGGSRQSVSGKLLEDKTKEIEDKKRPLIIQQAVLKKELEFLEKHIEEIELNYENKPLSKISKKQQIELHNLKPEYGKGPSYASLARDFNVPVEQVKKAINRQGLLKRLASEKREYTTQDLKINQEISSLDYEDLNSDYHFYRGMGGEIESRLVDRRKDLTPEERSLRNETAYREGLTAGGYPLDDRIDMIKEEGGRFEYTGKEGTDPLQYKQQPRREPEQTGFLSGIKKKLGLAQGGIMNNQMEMAFMKQGGLKDDGMRKDPVSGNPIPNGSMAEEVRDDIPAQLSEGEYVVPADVVRYYGVKHFEDIRNGAKQGLQNMEASGRIGGEPVPVGGPKASPIMQQQIPQQQQQMAGDLSQEEMAEIQSVMMSVGGFVEQPIGMQQQSDPYQQQNTMYQQPTVMGAQTGADLSPTAISGSWSKSPAQQAIEAATAKAEEEAEIEAGNTRCKAIGKIYNKETKLCEDDPNVQVQTSDDDFRNPGSGFDGGGTGSGSAGFEDWGKDWEDWSDPNAYADKIFAGVIGTKGLKAGAGIATALGGPGLAVAIGIGGKIALGQAISDLRAASIMAKAQGLPTEYIDDKAAKLIEQGGGLFELADFLGLASGKIKAGNNLKRLGMLSEEDNDGDFKFSPSQVKYNKDTTTKGSSDGSSGGGFSDTAVQIVDGQEVKPPKPVMRPRSRPTTSSSPTGKVSTAKPTAVSDKGQSTSDDFATGDPGMGGVFSNKGGLMRKKKTKGK